MSGTPGKARGVSEVEPLPFEAPNATAPCRKEAEAAVASLRELGLDDRLIEALVAGLRYERSTESIRESWPTLGDDRKHLMEIRDLATALSASICRASPAVEARLASATLKVFGDPLATDETPRHLKTFVRGVNAALATMDTQSRRTSRPGIPRLVERIVAPLGIKTTARDKTPFYKVCEAAFVLADVRGAEPKKRKPETGKSPANRPRSEQANPTRPSPSASIRVYLASAEFEERIAQSAGR